MKCFTIWFRRSDLEDFHRAIEATSRKAAVEWAKREAQKQHYRVMDITVGWLQIGPRRSEARKQRRINPR